MNQEQLQRELNQALKEVMFCKGEVSIILNEKVPQVVLTSQEGPTSTLRIRYYEMLKRWELETDNLFYNGVVYDCYYPVFEQVINIIKAYNKRLVELGIGCAFSL